MTYNALQVREAEDVITVTMNRPERRNALNPELIDELLHVLEQAGKRSSGVMILTGTGAAFCAGLDLDHLRSLNTKSSADHREDSARIGRLFRALYDLPLPTIAAVNGAAIAGGMGLATICDFTLSVPEAKFGFTEVRIGFVPAIVSSFLVPQIGEKQARDLLLTGRLIKAPEAKQMGLVNEILEEAELMPRAVQLAQSLLLNSPESLRATKKLLSSHAKDRLDRELQFAIEGNAIARSTGDFYEGVAAFLEKRTPDWPSRKKK
ncbi:MAG TPA: enoyl-CoA hydratase-related protein [Acidobacteriaceae bacterium]|jgi:methylglutaconyl-CoA hydratase|nr:enoyl-CoA hydratase-related protein [Acidobacteriaceae bacterium]